MEKQLTTLFGQIPESSEFLKALESVNKKKTKSRIFGNKVRMLSGPEIKKLKAQGNFSEDWKKILVRDKFKLTI